jgi:AcrR family transcriptional regulator
MSQTEARILRAARALLSEDPRRVTVAGVARRAGLARGTVYRRFEGRDALLARLAAEPDVDVPEHLLGDRHSRILDAVSTLIGQRGLLATTIEAVARRAGVGEATIYRAFGDRGGLLRAWADERSPRRMATSLLAGHGEPEQMLEALAVEALGFLSAHRSMVLLALSPDPESAALMAQIRNSPVAMGSAIADWLTRQMHAGRVRRDDPMRLARMFLGMVLSQALAELPDEDPTTTAHRIARTFCQGIRP